MNDPSAQPWKVTDENSNLIYTEDDQVVGAMDSPGMAFYVMAMHNEIAERLDRLEALIDKAERNHDDAERILADARWLHNDAFARLRQVENDNPDPPNKESP